MSLIKKSNSVLIKVNPENVTSGLSREDFIKKLSSVLSGKARKAILFGSFARNEYSGLSDIDLIIIAPTKREFLERFKDFPEVFELAPALDLLIYTQDEFNKLTSPPCSPFWKSVVEDSIEIPCEC